MPLSPYLGVALLPRPWHVWVLYLGSGLYYGAFEGAASALVADLVPAELRGTAYGLFNGAVGVAAFPASLLAGLLWDRYGAPAPFLLGGALALVAAGGMLADTRDSNAARGLSLLPLRLEPPA